MEGRDSQKSEQRGSQDAKRHAIIPEVRPLQEAAQQTPTSVQPEASAQRTPLVPPGVRMSAHLSREQQRMTAARSQVSHPSVSIPGQKPPGNSSLRQKIDRNPCTSTRTQPRTASSRTLPHRPISAESKSLQKTVPKVGAISKLEHSQTEGSETKDTVKDLKTKGRSASEKNFSAQKALTSGTSRRNSTSNIQARSGMHVEMKGGKEIVPDLKRNRKMASSAIKQHVDALGGESKEMAGKDRVEGATKKRLVSVESKQDTFETRCTFSEEAEDDMTDSKSSKVEESVEKLTPKSKKSRIPLFSPNDRRNSPSNVQARSGTHVEIKRTSGKEIVPDLNLIRKKPSSTIKPHVVALGRESIEMAEKDEVEGATKKGFVSVESKQDAFETRRTSTDDETGNKSSSVEESVEKLTPKSKESRIPSLFSPKDKRFRMKSIKTTPRDECSKNVIDSPRTPIDKTPIKQPDIIHPDLMLEHIQCGQPASSYQPEGSFSEVPNFEELEFELAIIICLVAVITLIIAQIGTQDVRKRE